jgi:hypothetical protein
VTGKFKIIAGCQRLTPILRKQRGGSWRNSLQDPILKIPNTKKGLVEWLKYHKIIIIMMMNKRSKAQTQELKQKQEVK